MIKKAILTCFKQLLSNVNRTLALLTKVIPGARLLSDVVGGLIISFDNPLNFHSKKL